MNDYLNAVSETLERGARKSNRTGVDTISTFNINYEACAACCALELYSHRHMRSLSM